MKRYVLGIGTAAAVATPIVASVSCSWINDKSVNHYKLMPTYTGEADQLLALGIKPDYYPLQLDSAKPYEYLTDPAKYLNMQDGKFRTDFTNKIKSLMNGVTLGTSWWNQQALDAGEKGSDPSYWQRQSADVLLYEHYLLDDDSKVIDSAIAPKHDEAMTIQTNFRWSRDPYTRLSKGVIFGLDKVDMKPVNGKIVWSWEGGVKPTPWTQAIGTDSCEVTAEDIDVIEQFINESLDSQGKGSWIYNSKFFAWIFHEMYLDNPEFANSEFSRWIVDTSKVPAFDLNKDVNDKLQKLFAASTYTDEEKQAGMKLPTYDYSKYADVQSLHTTYAHHPIYEQQEGEVGAAPMFEGSMRDNMLYLFNVSYQMQNLAKYGNTLGSKVASQEVVERMKLLPQYNDMVVAFDRAQEISKELWERMDAMKTYFKALGAEGKTFGLVTIAPGAGQSTIQSMSKYSFLYRELGFKQPLPNNLDTLAADAEAHASQDNALFNMDDNGWWWNLGNNTETITRNLQQFTNNGKGNMDIAVITARESDYNDIVGNQQPVRAALAKAIGTNTSTSTLPSLRVNYDLWNEGIKTPFVFHMVLDEIVEKTEAWAKANGTLSSGTQDARAKALNWGNYFRNTFTQ